MTKTGLLALAERLDDAPGVLGMLSRADLAEAAALLRKFAELRPVVFTSQSWLNEPNGFPRVVSSTRRAGFDKPLHDLTGVLDE